MIGISDVDTGRAGGRLSDGIVPLPNERIECDGAEMTFVGIHRRTNKMVARSQGGDLKEINPNNCITK